ncbi:inoine triphosphate pyrophosphatase [Cryptosporidium andersoni]|uniref:Inosine triphosphate pyrophosphatase n=1 Tax=Cryptosporidium andersoni TaxID=117008 RepID=A0A1J4MQU6_9CRYT|nr:inoine triphosphate pyrophosphatase [Cryptosporidium andersoni]
MELYFVSGNKNKAKELIDIIGNHYTIKIVDIDLPEYQGERHFITLNAYNKLKCPIIVEDTSLCFNVYNGLPGPYIKWFLKAIGNIGLVNMLKPYNDKSAYAVTQIAYFDGNNMDQPILFEGIVDGVIVTPRGNTTFGWDCIFQPIGYNLTYSEMEPKLKNSISQRSKCLKKLKEYLEEKLPLK